MGNCGVVDLVDKTGEVALTIGGLSGIFKGHDYLKGRFERTPYDKSSMRSVYHVRNIDEFRLKSMPPGNYFDYRLWFFATEETKSGIQRWQKRPKIFH